MNSRPSSRRAAQKAPSRTAPPAELHTDPHETSYRTGNIPGSAILPLRLFLGVTFVYGAIQKLADSGFLRPGAGTYIGSQMLGFSHGSPIRFLLTHLMEHAVAVGYLTIATELLIGVAALVGFLTRPAALIGLALNFGFFLSASWHAYPYFYGSDIVFVVAWLTLALTGPGPYAVDAVLRPRVERFLHGEFPLVLATATGTVLLAPPSVPGRPVQQDGAERRGRILTRAEAGLGGVGALVLVLLGIVPRNSGGSSTNLAGGPASASAPGPSSGGTPMPAGARKIGNVSQLPVNSAGVVKDPASGDPAIVVHTSGSTFVAYDAVCTHAGCTVEYDPTQKMLVCPCHGGMFDPARNAAVTAGPPPTPLARIPLTIDGKGDIYIV